MKPRRRWFRFSDLLWVLLLVNLMMAGVYGALVATAYLMAVNHWKHDARDAWLVFPLLLGSIAGVIATAVIRKCHYRKTL